MHGLWYVRASRFLLTHAVICYLLSVFYCYIELMTINFMLFILREIYFVKAKLDCLCEFSDHLLAGDITDIHSKTKFKTFAVPSWRASPEN